MTLLPGENSDYDYSALSCASDTSFNHTFFPETETLKGLFYQRAKLIHPQEDLLKGFRPDDRKHHIIINVGGIKYLLPWTTLDEFPLTRLGQLKFCNNFDDILNICDDYDVTCNEFFFDRNPGAFRTILTFLRVGKLRLLREMCALSFQEELLYWGIEEDNLDWCCKRRYLDKVGLVLRILRALRILYVMRLARHSLGLQTLGLTARRCTREFGLLLLFLCVAIALFAPLLYVIENEMADSQEFTSIPACYWWAVITMTTVGYGDMVPRSIPGQVVALSSILSGILLMAFPVTSIFHTFSRSYIEPSIAQNQYLPALTAHFLSFPRLIHCTWRPRNTKQHKEPRSRAVSLFLVRVRLKTAKQWQS